LPISFIPFILLILTSTNPRLEPIILEQKTLTTSVDFIAYHVAVCDEYYNEFLIPLMCYFAALWFSMLIVAWRVKDVPEGFNESSNLFTILAFVCIYSLEVLPIQFLVQSQLEAVMILRSVGLYIGSIFTVAVLIVPKLAYIYTTSNANDTVITTKLSSHGRKPLVHDNDNDAMGPDVLSGNGAIAMIRINSETAGGNTPRGRGGGKTAHTISPSPRKSIPPVANNTGSPSLPDRQTTGGEPALNQPNTNS
jgi:hypothetical protein